MNTRRPTDAAGPSWRKFVDEQPTRWPDPLDATELDRTYEAGFEDGLATGLSRTQLPLARIGLLILTAFVVGLLAGTRITTAASRPGQAVIPAEARESVAVETSEASSGNLPGRTGAPSAVGLLPEDPDGPGSRTTDVVHDLSIGQDGAPPSSPASSGSPSAPAVTEPPAIAAGIATWYDDGPGLYAAAPWWRWGDPRIRVSVCSRAGRCVVVTVRDACGCPGGRVIDLSPAAFARLAPLSRGLVEVTVEDAP